MITLDPRGYILSWNAGAEHMRGYTAQEIVGQSVSCFFQKEDVDCGKPARDLELAKQQGYFEETGWRVRKDGSQFWANVTITPLQDEHGQFCGFAQITRDLTVEQEVEKTKAVDSALEALDRRLQTLLRLFSGIDDAIFIHGLDGSILEVNEAVLRLYKVTREQALQLSLTDDYSSPDNPLEQLPHLWQRAIVGEVQRFEWIARRPGDGTCFDAEVTLQKLMLQDQTVILASVRNITKRKSLEKQLAQQQARFNAFFCNANVGLVIMDDQLRHVHVNQALAESNGLSVEAHLGKTLSDILPDVAAAVEPVYQQVLATGQPILNQEVSGETYKQPGVVRHWLASYFPLIDESEGRPIGAGAVIVDITERKQAEEALQRTRAFLDSVVDHMPIAVFGKDAATCEFVVWNRACADLTGVSTEDARGKTNRDIFPPQQAELYDALDREALTKGELSTPDQPLQSRAKGLRYVRTKKILVRDSTGKPHYIVGICEDITERRQAEEALRESEAALREKAQQLETALWDLRRTQAQMIQSEKMSSLGQLIAGVAHEINNPVSFIYGNLRYADDYTQDLLKLLQLYQQHYPSPLPEVQTQAEAIDLNFLMTDLPKLLCSMKVGAERIQKIVLSLRTFSHMDETEMKAVNIHEGIDNTLLILQNRLKAQSKRPAIEVTKRYGNVPPVECYAGQLNQVFMNILTNAIDALEVAIAQDIDGWSAAIDIQTQLVQPDRVQIRFIDNGPGIAEDVQSRLFDPFFTTKPVGKGTGLGLSISYQIVTERHNGELRCISLPGRGTEFVIEIPIWRTIKASC